MSKINNKEKLRKSEERLAEAQRIAHIGNWELDITDDKLYWSDEIFRIFDINPDKFDASYEAFLETVHPDDRELVNSAYSDSLKNKTPYEIEHRLCLKDGSIKWVHERCLTYYDDDSNPIRSVGTVQDITSKKLVETELKKAHDELELRVKERTNELVLTNKKLTSTIKEVEKANALKTRFLNAASHDLRQPLQALSMYISVLTKNYEDTRNKEIINKVNVTLHNISSILDVLLDISRLESGVIEPKIKSFLISDLFEQIYSNLSPFAQAKSLNFDVSNADLQIQSDFVLLQRIIENIVSNAIKYTDKGGIELDCKDTADSIQITVKDTGIGIDDESIDKIFEDYFQIDNPTRLHSKGLGLGLSIVRQISGLLGCKVEVKSALKKGTTFTIIIPKKVLIKTNAKEESRNESFDKCDAVVLLVDDDDMVLDSITMLLETENYNVLSAMNGNDALDIVNNKVPPDIIVTDYRLPSMLGSEVIAKLRQKLDNNIPAIILTGDTALEEITRDNLDNCRVLNKPIDTDKLINNISEMINQ